MVKLIRVSLVVFVLVFAGSALREPAYVLHGQVAGGVQASAALQPSAQQPEPVDEFVPIEQLPPQDQLPAAPLLVSAYAFVLVALFVYVVSVARRMGGVQRELERLESDLRRSGPR